MKLNRFTKVCAKNGNSGAQLKMTTTDIGQVFYVFTKEELELVLGRDLQ